MGFAESTHAKGLRVKPAGPFAILLFAYQPDALARKDIAIALAPC